MMILARWMVRVIRAYYDIDYLKNWGNKKRSKMNVWGSGKSTKGSLVKDQFSRSNLTVLVLLSHPNELKIFYSWLRADKRLQSPINYLIRIYKPGYKSFENIFDIVINDFDFVQKSNGTLIEDIGRCDIAIFSGTTAGIETINLGYISLYVDLNDFIEMNPCFDNLNAVLPSYSAAEFANTLDKICSMNNQSIKELYDDQITLSNRIFSPINTNAIIEDLSFGKN